MSTRIQASFEFSQYGALPLSKRFKLQFLVVTRAHESAVALRSAFPRLFFCRGAHPSSISMSKRMAWSIRSSADSSGLNPPPGNGITNRTRLIRVLQVLQVKAVARIQEIKNRLPLKVLLFLVGFYCATAFSTVIGQTGDWDVLSAGLTVIVVEGIGALMYNSSFRLLNKIRGLITMFNYWKSGLTLGLFLDAFKYEIDNILGLPNPFNFEFDVFPANMIL